jgi:tRNA nucleotidyltransferase (CCA-adding enzyme)
MEKKVMKIKFPDDVKELLQLINKEGFEVYLVGGCVRDIIMGITPKDWDISSAAKPEDIKKIFKTTYDTGTKYGTVTALFKNIYYEITTFRLEGEYENNRKPSKIEYIDNLFSDLKRRDFTINAIASDLNGNVIDYFNGISDINKGIVRCVGDPNERFKEDALRMMRAIRFSCQLNFGIHNDTFKAIVENRELISNISIERIRDELNKILLSDNNLYLIKDTGILDTILPELKESFFTEQKNSYHVYNVGIHTLKSVESVEKDTVLKWVMLLHDIGKPFCKTIDKNNADHFCGYEKISVDIAERVLERYKIDKKSKAKILELIKWHDKDIAADLVSIKRILGEIGDENFLDLIKVKRADMKAQNMIYCEKNNFKLLKILELYNKIHEENQCYKIKDLKITGIDLLKIGFKENEEIGNVLSKLLDIVLENPKANSKKELEKIANIIYNNFK